MPLTEAQVAKARTFPGCGDLTADNAMERLFAATETALADAGTAATDNVTLNQRVASLETELTQAKSQIPVAVSAPVLKAMAGAAQVHLQAAIDKQAISPEVGNQLAAHLIGEGEALSQTGLTPNNAGECVATSVFKVLAANPAMPKVGKTPDVQAAPKATPGAPEQTTALSKEEKNRLLAVAGVPAKFRDK
jgi:hypothetical protein